MSSPLSYCRMFVACFGVRDEVCPINFLFKALYVPYHELPGLRLVDVLHRTKIVYTSNTQTTSVLMATREVLAECLCVGGGEGVRPSKLKRARCLGCPRLGLALTDGCCTGTETEVFGWRGIGSGRSVCPYSTGDGYRVLQFLWLRRDFVPIALLLGSLKNTAVVDVFVLFFTLKLPAGVTLCK